MYKVDVIGGKYNNAIVLCATFQEVENWITKHWDDNSYYWVTSEQDNITMEYRDILSLRYN